MARSRPVRRIVPLLILLTGCARGPSPAPEAREGFLTTADSVRLYYRVVGSGPETVIVPLALFHATTLDVLADSYRVVLYDPRGRGRSDTVPVGKVSLGHNVNDLDAVRAEVGADRVSLIGWSGFGMELFVYALRHPERVTRLIQLAPVAPRWEPYAAFMGQDRARRTDSAASAALSERVTRGDFLGDPAGWCRASAQVHQPPTFGDTAFARRAPDVCQHPAEWPPQLGAYFRAFFPSIAGFNWTDSLVRVAGLPRLVIHGERDNTPLQGNREWVAGQPNARLLVVPGAGHWPQLERPELTLPAIRAFLRGEWPAGAGAVP